MQFTHNALVTTDVETMIQFYGRWCGTRVVRDRVTDEGTRVTWIAAPNRRDFVFVLIETSNPENVSPTHKTLGAHYGFLLPSKDAVDALHAEMKNAGVEVGDCEMRGGVVGYIFFAKDPDGRNLEFAFGQDVSDANWEIPD